VESTWIAVAEKLEADLQLEPGQGPSWRNCQDRYASQLKTQRKKLERDKRSSGDPGPDPTPLEELCLEMMAVCRFPSSACPLSLIISLYSWKTMHASRLKKPKRQRMIRFVDTCVAVLFCIVLFCSRTNAGQEMKKNIDGSMLKAAAMKGMVRLNEAFPSPSPSVSEADEIDAGGGGGQPPT
jgi:hypothetical protein